ncbi:MAG: PGPGW domain-containing protein [Verrucomicrobiales bacterium]|nr:PGPGW domain-containing protein [Verrucomicrobiales bacterium]
MKKVFIALIGGTLLLIGLALMVLPGPGLPILTAGLALLASEFFWARRVWRKAKGAVASARRRAGLRDWLRRAGGRFKIGRLRVRSQSGPRNNAC